MPRVVKMYEKSKGSLKHNMGPRSPRKKQMPGPELEGYTAEELVLQPEPKPEKPKGTFGDIGRKARSDIEKRKKALREALED